jgi:hypothetical protein
MKLGKYRVSAGHYRFYEWNIYRHGTNWWQVRDEHDQIMEQFSTLREALQFAKTYHPKKGAIALARNVKPIRLPLIS